jgi:hypothetical protein
MGSSSFAVLFHYKNGTSRVSCSATGDLLLGLGPSWDISMTGAGGLSSSLRPVTAKPVHPLTLKGGRCGDLPAERGCVGDRGADQGEGFPLQAFQIAVQ